MEPVGMFLDHLLWWVAGAVVIAYLLLTPVIRSRRRSRAADVSPASSVADARETGTARVEASEVDAQGSGSGDDNGGLTLSDAGSVGEAAGGLVENRPPTSGPEPADDAPALELSLDDSAPIVDATPDAERRTDDPDEGLSLDLEEDFSPEPSVSAGTGQGRSTYPASGAVSYRGTADDNETRLEMAKAYVDLGDAQGATALLDLVEVEGSDEERTAAARLREVLDGSGSSAADYGAVGPSPGEHPETDLERVLDLALAYIEIGENESAKLLIDRVLRDGSDAQRRQAEELRARMA